MYWRISHLSFILLQYSGNQRIWGVSTTEKMKPSLKIWICTINFLLRKNGGPLIKIIGLSLNYQQPKALKRTKWKMFPLFNKIPKLNKNTVDETLNIYIIYLIIQMLWSGISFQYLYVCKYKILNLKRNIKITIFDVVLCVFLFNFLILSGITLQNVWATTFMVFK